MSKATGLDKAIIIGRSMNNAVAIAIKEEGEVDIETIETYAEGLINLELGLYEKYGAGGSDGAPPSSKNSWGGSKPQASTPRSSSGGKGPTDAQRNVLIKHIGWTEEQVNNAEYKEWKTALDVHFKNRG